MEHPEIAINYIEFLKQNHQGKASFLNTMENAEIIRVDKGYTFRVDKRLSLDINDLVLDFENDGIRLITQGSVNSTHTSIDIEKKQAVLYSKGKIYSFTNHLWSESPALFQSFYFTKEIHLIHQLCGKATGITISVCGHEFNIYNESDYLVLECSEKLAHYVFSEISYNLLVAIGFITGEFIQNEVFTFQYATNEQSNQEIQGIKYRKLRKSCSSIYTAVATNPYQRSHLLDIETVKALNENKTLKYLDATVISNLAELSMNNKQIQYALVLFNEANDSNQSLLIRNNCFFVVLEVMKKYFYDLFKSKLPQNYSSKGNVDKYILLFQQLFPINEDEVQTIKMRNDFLHGDILYVSDEEMIPVMQKQITFIYKLVLTHIGFNGHIIDHFVTDKNQSRYPFIKVGN